MIIPVSTPLASDTSGKTSGDEMQRPAGKPTVETDREYFIRKTFENDPAKGCELMFRMYYNPMCSYAVRFVCSKAVAEDLVSDIFYSFWKNQTYLTIKSSYRAYLFKSVQNRSYNFLSGEFKQTDSIDLIPDEHFESADLAENLVQMEELGQKIERIVNGLPPQCQRVFVLNRYENKKNREIAEELSLSYRTVETHISKALQALREGLKDHWLPLVFWTYLFI